MNCTCYIAESTDGIRLDLIAALRARAIEIERVADALSADQSAA